MMYINGRRRADNCIHPNSGYADYVVITRPKPNDYLPEHRLWPVTGSHPVGVLGRSFSYFRTDQRRKWLADLGRADRFIPWLSGNGRDRMAVRRLRNAGLGAAVHRPVSRWAWRPANLAFAELGHPREGRRRCQQPADC